MAISNYLRPAEGSKATGRRPARSCAPARRPVWSSEIVIDLGALQGAREIAVPHLGLRVELVDLPAALAMPVARLLYPAERQVCLGAHRPRAGVSDAVVQLVHLA